MDRKSTVIVVVCVILMFAWFPLMNKWYPQKPLPPGTNTVATAQSPAFTNAAGTVTTTTATAATTAIGPGTRPVLPPVEGEQTIVLTNNDARFTFTSRGGGLQLIELTHYPETVSRQSKKHPLTNGVATLNTKLAAPVLAVQGDAALTGDGAFALTRTATGVRAEKMLTNGLRIVKEFSPSTNYLLLTTVRLENSSSNQPLSLPEQEWSIGTATPLGPDDHGDSVGLLWYNGAKKEDILGMWFENRTLGCFKGVPRTEYRAGTSNVVWGGVHNQFFALIAMPKDRAELIIGRPLDLPRPATGKASLPENPPPKAFETALVYPKVTLAPGQAIERQITFYAGPKEYRTLARIGSQFDNKLDLVMGFGFFGFFSKMLLLSMNWLHNNLSFSYGWAIIAITFIIKMVFWPLTAKSTRSMKRMQALAPQMKALQEKYKDDPQKFNQKQWEFWKKNKVNPVSGCLPMIVQMPVFFGFFAMLRSAIELRGASWLWVADLSKADTLFMIPGLSFIPFLGVPGEGLPFNLLPIIYICTALWQSHLTPPSPGMDPAQQRMMRWMPLMFLVILYNFSSGLALYWTVQNLLTILQTKLTKNDPEPAATPAPALTSPPKKKK